RQLLTTNAANLEKQRKDLQDKLGVDSLPAGIKVLDRSIKDLKDKQKKQEQGLVLSNTKPPELSDMFEYDDDSTPNLVDLSKVQMFFFTIAVLVAYTVALAGVMKEQAILMQPFGVDFPTFSSSLNALLAISHAGYLTVNSINRTVST